MEIKKADLTTFAKGLAYTHHQYHNVMCMAEEITKSDIGRKFMDGMDEKLLIEIAKRYAKYVRNECSVDIDNGETQTCQNIINEGVNCCEENNWFQKIKN